MYKTPINTLEKLKERIVAACETIRNTSGIFERVLISMRRWAQTCLSSEGGHFNNFYKIKSNKTKYSHTKMSIANYFFFLKNFREHVCRKNNFCKLNIWFYILLTHFKIRNTIWRIFEDILKTLLKKIHQPVAKKLNRYGHILMWTFLHKMTW